MVVWNRYLCRLSSIVHCLSSAAGSRRVAQPHFQTRFDGRPLFLNNTEHHGIAHIAVLHDDLLAQGAFPLCAQLGDGLLAVDIAPVSLELHAYGPQRLEGVAQQEVLALGVYPGALVGEGYPGVAYLQAPVLGADIEVASDADRFPGLAEHRDEWEEGGPPP